MPKYDDHSPGGSRSKCVDSRTDKDTRQQLFCLPITFLLSPPLCLSSPRISRFHYPGTRPATFLISHEDAQRLHTHKRARLATERWYVWCRSLEASFLDAVWLRVASDIKKNPNAFSFLNPSVSTRPTFLHPSCGFTLFGSLLQEIPVLSWLTQSVQEPNTVTHDVCCTRGSWPFLATLAAPRQRWRCWLSNRSVTQILCSDY